MTPKKRYKIVVYVPESDAQKLRNAIGDAGAGIIGNYTHCTFTMKGTGRFKPANGRARAVAKDSDSSSVRTSIIAGIKIQIDLVVLQIEKILGHKISPETGGVTVTAPAVQPQGSDATFSGVFTRNFIGGTTGPDVEALQKILNKQGYLVLPPGFDYGYYGPLTKAAVTKWQKAHGLQSVGGRFGEASRAIINK